MVNWGALSAELDFETSRSGGKGGQHANKAETRVTLCFHVEKSHQLTPQQKGRIIQRLSNRINQEGVLKMSCEDERSQHANKKMVKKRFEKLLRKALTPKKKRKKTKPPKSADEKRLEEKRKQSEKKQRRRIDKNPRKWLEE